MEHLIAYMATKGKAVQQQKQANEVGTSIGWTCVVRSNTGTYHITKGVRMPNGTTVAVVNGTRCNIDGQRRTLEFRVATENEVPNMPSEAKCKKCFR